MATRRPSECARFGELDVAVGDASAANAVFSPVFIIVVVVVVVAPATLSRSYNASNAPGGGLGRVTLSAYG